MRLDYLTDGGEMREKTVRPRVGERVHTDFHRAASLSLAATSAHVEINPGGVPTWHEWFAESDIVKFDEYYGRENGRVMMYAVVYLQVAEDIEVNIGFASDDSIDRHEPTSSSISGANRRRSASGTASSGTPRPIACCTIAPTASCAARNGMPRPTR